MYLRGAGHRVRRGTDPKGLGCVNWGPGEWGSRESEGSTEGSRGGDRECV